MMKNGFILFNLIVSENQQNVRGAAVRPQLEKT